MKKKLDFGVFYTCFTEKDSVDFSVKKLYEIYPNIPVYLVSDGGLDYSYLEEKYNGIKTVKDFDSRGFVPKINESNFKEEKIRNYMVDSIYTFMERINDSIKFCKKPYVLIMEPDVLVRGELTIEDGVDLMGSRINHYHWCKKEINEVLSNIEGSVPVEYYGTTPAIFSVESFNKVYNFYQKNRDIIESFCSIDPNFSNYDIFLTVLFASMGYDEIQNPELTECLRNSSWENSHHPLLHQFRIYYPKENYTGRHSIKTN